MPKVDDVVLTNLEARVSHGEPSGGVIQVLVHNVTDEEIKNNALTIGFFAEAKSGQTQSAATETFYVPAISASGMHSSSGPMQLDPGDWAVSATVFDSETNDALAHHQPIDVHIPGQVHHAQAFDNSHKYDINVQIQSVERLGKTLYRIHYLLGNHGTSTVPPGMLVRAMIVENDDNIAWQDYHFELSCPPGEPDPKYLTVEGSSSFSNAAVYIIADPSGPSEVSDAAHLTVDDSGVHLTR